MAASASRPVALRSSPLVLVSVGLTEIIGLNQPLQNKEGAPLVGQPPPYFASIVGEVINFPVLLRLEQLVLHARRSEQGVVHDPVNSLPFAVLSDCHQHPDLWALAAACLWVFLAELLLQYFN